ncbi:MAG: helix-turn-helix-domain containing protein AraC type [Akkermansiaceae bacterium]|nr:helix-turn-helix-domain containing protein AraC type [Akkermansiaceae bacterium]
MNRAPHSTPPPRVALIVETSGIYGRKILSGISRYLRCHQRWSVFLEQRELGSRPPAWLLNEKWDGIVSRPTDPALARVYRKMNTPVVDLNDLHDHLGLPWVGSDHLLMGRLAATHLQERGLRHFAFCGYSSQRWSEKRRQGFIDTATVDGRPIPVFESLLKGSGASNGEKDLTRITQWLARLPKPVGVMACNDVRALDVLNACERAGLRVPEDVAVVGVDNEEIHCDFCHPPLSSVEPDPEAIGYHAAELLDALMAGKSPAQTSILVPPLQVVPRPSTDLLAVEDELVKRAVRHIRDHARGDCHVEDLARLFNVSRSTLERRFRTALDRSPQTEIRLTRINEVRRLLTETNATLEHIAELCGFDHPEYLSVLFKRLTKQTPGEYRRQFQLSRQSKSH